MSELDGKSNTKSTGVARAAGGLVAGILIGGVVALYTLCWTLYGLGYESYPCNIAGGIMLFACPAAGIGLLIAVEKSVVKPDTRWSIPEKWRTAVRLFAVGFLFGPITMLLMNYVIYDLGNLYGFYPPLQGW